MLPQLYQAGIPFLTKVRGAGNTPPDPFDQNERVIRKPAHLSKVSKIIWGDQESLAGFLPGGLLEVTPIDPDAPEKQQTINIAFLTQSTTDIHRKL